MMELSTGVKQSWNWEKKDLNLLQQPRQKHSMLKFSVGLFIANLANFIHLYFGRAS